MSEEVTPQPAPAPYRNQKGQFTGVNPWTKYFPAGPHKLKRYCSYGHPMFGDNLRTVRRVRVNPKTGKSYEYMERVCYLCAAERQRRYKAKRGRRLQGMTS